MFSHHVKWGQPGVAHDLEGKSALRLGWYVHMLQWSARYRVDFNTELVFAIVLYYIHLSHEVTALIIISAQASVGRMTHGINSSEP